VKKFSEFYANKLNENLGPDLSKGMYPEVTLQQDKMGSLHMWMGNKDLVQTGKYLYKSKDGKDADVFVQNSDDVDAILNHLNPEDREHVVKGFKLVTHEVPDDYFQQD